MRLNNDCKKAERHNTHFPFPPRSAMDQQQPAGARSPGASQSGERAVRDTQQQHRHGAGRRLCHPALQDVECNRRLGEC